MTLLLISTNGKAEGLYLTLGAGKNGQIFSDDPTWNDAGDSGAFIAVFYKWDKQGWCLCYPSINYAHLSQWGAGPPFNDKVESSVDHLGIAATWAIWER